VKSLFFILIIILSFVLPSPVFAAPCYTVNDANLAIASRRQICIVRIKRSAKYHWQYRVQLQIDGEVQPRELWNCRDRLRTYRDGRTRPFEPDGIGDRLCQILDL